MQTTQPLNLVQQLLLLALRDQKGTPHPTTSYSHALGAGILAELILSGRARIEIDGKQKRIQLADPRPLGDPVLDECLERLATAKRPAAPATWVMRFAGLKRLLPRVAAGLCERGILRGEERTILLLFRRRVFPELNPKPEREILRELRRAIFIERGAVSVRTAILVTLANQAGLLSHCFDTRALKKQKTRIQQIASGNAIGAAAKEAVEAAQTMAVMTAVMLPAMTATVR